MSFLIDTNLKKIVWIVWAVLAINKLMGLIGLINFQTSMREFPLSRFEADLQGAIISTVVYVAIYTIVALLVVVLLTKNKVNT